METFKIVNPIHPSEEGFCDIDISVWLESDTINDVVYSATTNRGADATSDVLDLGLSTYYGHHIRPYIKGGINKTSYKVLALVSISPVGEVGAFVIEFDTKQHHS